MDGKICLYSFVHSVMIAVVSSRTALHWACKRNHTSVMRFLIANGADVNLNTFKQESAASLASSEEALLLLGCSLEKRVENLMVNSQSDLPIVPHYLKNPPFPYGETVHQDPESIPIEDPSRHLRIANSKGDTGRGKTTNDHRYDTDPPLVLKLRINGSQDSDFIEVEISSLTYQSLLETCAEELEVDVTTISKIRKLPNVIVRNDRDVQRMSSGQELEVMLH